MYGIDTLVKKKNITPLLGLYNEEQNLLPSRYRLHYLTQEGQGQGQYDRTSLFEFPKPSCLRHQMCISFSSATVVLALARRGEGARW